MPDPKREPARGGEILQSVADTTKAAADLGFRAEIDLEAGLTCMLAAEYGLSYLQGSLCEPRNGTEL